MDLSYKEIARMIDLSAVRAEQGDAAIAALAETARRCGVGGVHSLPAYIPLLHSLLEDAPEISIGAPVGFPSGGQTRRIKAAEAQELVAMGCAEVDMVANIGKLISGSWGEVLEEIRGVVAVVEGRTVRVILECHYLNADQIRRGCDLSITGGARYVKTGTGWAPSGATRENVALIKAHVGEAIGIKAAGGIRTRDTLVELYRLGATRFGIGLSSAEKILDEARDY